ncbi:hypothetical protein BH20CHL3_BH20CHL3_10290 [soil metagenome]
MNAVDSASRHVFAIAAPQAITGAMALIVSVFGSNGGVPLAVIAVLAVQLVGYAATRAVEPASLGRAWLVGLVTAVIALPIFAIQLTLAREPYAGTTYGSSAPLIAATAAVALTLVLTALLLAIVSHDAPEEAALLFMPLALLIPAVIGIRSEVAEVAAIRALAESSLVAAGASVIAWSLPRATRPLIAPAAMAVQFILLWMMGRGPSFSSTSGELAPLALGGQLALAVILVVAVPLLAVGATRFVQGSAIDGRSTNETLPRLERR